MCEEQSGFRGVHGVASKRANEGFVKRFSVWIQSLTRRARVFKASERRRHSVGSARRDAEPACTSSLPFWGSGRGGLHVESAIDSYGEVIDRFGLRLAVEPRSLLTSRLDTIADLLAGARHLDLGLVW